VLRPTGWRRPRPARLGEATGENADELADAIETLARLQRSGTLDDLLAMADLLALASNAMDDEMVTDLAATGTRLGEVADTATDDDVARTLEDVLEAVGEAGDEPTKPAWCTRAGACPQRPRRSAGSGVRDRHRSQYGAEATGAVRAIRSVTALAVAHQRDTCRKYRHEP